MAESKIKLFRECMESDVKPHLDDEVFEGLTDLLVAIGAECRKCGAKPFTEKRDPDDAACEYFVDGRAEDGRD